MVTETITTQQIDETAKRYDLPPVIAIRLLVTGTTAAAMFSKPTLQRINRLWKQYTKETAQ